MFALIRSTSRLSRLGCVGSGSPARTRGIGGAMQTQLRMRPADTCAQADAQTFPGPSYLPQPGVYRHYAHGDLYRVHGTVLHTETSEHMVLYSAVHPDQERNPLGMSFVRPAAMFAETIELDGYSQPRFQRIAAKKPGLRAQAGSGLLRSEPVSFSRSFATRASEADVSLKSVYVSASEKDTQHLCSDNMRYWLINLVQVPIDREEVTAKRRHAYSQLYELARENKLSQIRVTNLYALLYSKFFTIRFMVRTSHPDEKELLQIENDDAIKAQFRALLRRVDCGEVNSKVDFHKQYMDIILAGRSPPVIREFERVTKIIDGQLESEWERSRQHFFIGATMTTPHLTKKLGDDLKLFRSKKERLLEFLDKYKFVNGWITTVGVFIFGGAAATFGFKTQSK